VTARFEPVVHECRLTLRDDRPFNFEVRVAPVLRILSVARPHIGDSDTAREADFSVYNKQLSMCAVVHSAEVVPTQRVVAFHFDTRVLHFLD